MSFDIAICVTMLGRDANERHGFVNPPLYRGSTVIHKSIEDIERERAGNTG